MKKLSSREIRASFLNYFSKHDHLKIDGASVVPKNDPTLLFINSGMAPLKSFFLGKETPPSPRLCNVQPCIRTKDIDDVGDRHHLTIFEMLGSWSIGDYYKERAVELAMGLLVGELGFDPERLFVTVYEGDEQLGLPPDLVSADAWEAQGIDRSRIIALGADNFWGPAGEVGPCGPCTEVFYDCGDAYGPPYKAGDPFDTTKRYIEIWNAGVFMEFNKTRSGSFEPLPLKSVDTGSGLERMAMVMNGLDTVYETDLMAPLMATAKELLGGGTVTDQRVLTDHMRAASFIMAEGVAPNNEGAGYIPRRLLRKCIALMVKAGSDSEDLCQLSQAVTTALGAWYPVLERREADVLRLVRTEIAEFEPVIRSGLKHLDESIASRPEGYLLPGRDAFTASATHGLPLEIIRSHLAARGMGLDEPGYEAAFREHQEVSRAGKKADSGLEAKGQSLPDSLIAEKTQFDGYDTLSSDGVVLALIGPDKVACEVLLQGQVGVVITDKTPFYGESGGQVGDTGRLIGHDGSCFKVDDTQKHEGVFLHRGKLETGSLKAGVKMSLQVEPKRRAQIKANHSATHLLHSALRQVLGEHVVQKGSHVGPERLRFDFQHSAALSTDELIRVESLVNQWIRAQIRTDVDETSYDEAIDKGAMALFGENYGDTVRVVSFPGASVELCGGTHVDSTGDIGLFMIISESSVAKGVRRIEALTAEAAISRMQADRAILSAACQEAGVRREGIVEAIAGLKKRKKGAGDAGGTIECEQISEVGGLKVLTGKLSEMDAKAMRSLAEKTLDRLKEGVVFLASSAEGGLKVLVMVDKKSSKKVPANELLKPILGSIGGRGGGKPQFAQGGGSFNGDVDGILASVTELVSELLT